MTPAQADANALRVVGWAMFGPNWHAPLAQALKVAPRTLRRWLAEQTPIPPTVWPEFEKLIRERIKHLELALLSLDTCPHTEESANAPLF